MAFLEHKTYSKEAFDKEHIKISSSNEVSQEDYAFMFTCINILIETFLKSNTTANEFIDSLKELKFSDECIDDLKVLVKNQNSLTDHFLEMKLIKPMNKFNYRINISLVESGQSPTIILHLEQNERIQVINLSLKMFHRFRLAVATILGEMHALEGKRN